MRARLLLGLAAGFVVGGCSDQPNPTPSEPAFSHTETSPGCDFNGLNSLIAQYFTTQTQQQAVQKLRDSLVAAHNDGSNTRVKAWAFEILAEIEKAVNLGQAGSPTVGSTLAHDVLECSHTPSELPSQFPDNFFVEELTPLSAGGLGAFGVRPGSGTPDNVPIFARDGFSGIAPPPDSEWSDVLTERMLWYGSRASQSSYEWDRIRATDANGEELENLKLPGPVIGLCVIEGPNSFVLQNGTSEPAYLSWVNPSYFLTCSPPAFEVASGGKANGWGPFALAQRLVGLLSPRPAHAVVAFSHSTSGGSLCCRTHYEPEPLNNVVLDIVQEPPSNPILGVPVTVKVKATADGQPFLNATIVLVIITTTTKGTNVMVTGNTGVTQLEDCSGVRCAIATINETFNKTGVYKQIATVAQSSIGDPVADPTLDDRTTGFTPDTTAAFNVRKR